MLGQWFSWGASLLTYLLLTSSPLLSFPLYSHMRGTLGAQPTFFQFLPARILAIGSSFSLCWLCEPLLESRVMSKLSLGAFPFVVEFL